MSILDFLRSKKLKLTEVKMEENRLNAREKKLLAQIEDMSREKESLFRKGGESSSRALRMSYARRFEELGKRLALMEREALLISKQLRLISRLRMILERDPKKGVGLLSRLSESQLTKISTMIEDGNMKEEEFAMKLDTMLGVVDESGIDTSLEGEASDVMKVWESMDRGTIDVDEGLKQADEKLRNKSKEL